MLTPDSGRSAVRKADVPSLCQISTPQGGLERTQEDSTAENHWPDRRFRAPGRTVAPGVTGSTPVGRPGRSVGWA
jgi:hypothetical protein